MSRKNVSKGASDHFIAFTGDIYGQLWPDDEDDDETANAADASIFNAK